MVRITRRDFLKYCSIAAGALGLSASTLMKVEKVLANTAAPTVIWVAGSACTGCTMSLLNSVFYTTVDDLLLNRINLAYLDTAMATAGAYTDTETPGVPTQYPGANALKVAQDIYQGTTGFVLVVEGAIPTATPPGGLKGSYCRIGNLTGLTPVQAAAVELTGVDPESVYYNVNAFANHDNCLAVLSVGTCSSFGGIPGAKGNVAGAQGVAFSGTTPGGAIVPNTGTISNIKVTDGGDLYHAAPTVNIAGSGGANAVARIDYQTVTGITFTGSPSGLNNVVVTITGNGTGATAYAQVNSSGTITALLVSSGGSGYTSATVTVTSTVAGVTSPVTFTTGPTAAIGTGKVLNVAVTLPGSGYTSVPAISFTPVSGGTGAAATASITKGNVKGRQGLAAKCFSISGCPPHPDWIVGTIAALLDTNLSVMPAVNSNYQPVDYGYKEYQCNAGPCTWRFNNNAARDGVDHNDRYVDEGDSRRYGREKWRSNALGCIGILGCKGRKTKADCSRRRWNADGAEQYGVNWCVGSRAGCHGCTEPTFPDKVGKFFTFA